MAESRARLYAPDWIGLEAGDLDGEGFHYLHHVLRIRPGELFTLFGCEPWESVCEVVSIGPDSISFKRVRVRDVDTESPIDLTLAVAVGKGKKVEEILEAVTALGIRAYVPFVADRSVAKRSNPRLPERLEAISLSACRQSGRTLPPEVFEVQPDLNSALQKIAPPAQRFFFDESGGTPIVEALREVELQRPICLLCGPEGGWSPTERDTLLESGALPLTLGPRILRMELAAIAGVALVENILASRISSPKEGMG